MSAFPHSCYLISSIEICPGLWQCNSVPVIHFLVHNPQRLIGSKRLTLLESFFCSDIGSYLRWTGVWSWFYTILSKVFGLFHVPSLFIHLSNAQNCERIEIWIWDKKDVCFHANISLPQLLKQSLILKPCTPRTFLQQIKITLLLCVW